jgi:hypothetical protein
MPANLIEDLSRAELKREIDTLAAQDGRSLPQNAKIFAAIAKLQQFDRLPDALPFDEIQKRIASSKR